MSTTDHNWYVQYSGQNYGPYTTAHMQAFVTEGRVIATSLITHDISRGFYRASAYPIFTSWVQNTQQNQALAQSEPAQSVVGQLAVGQSHAQPLELGAPSVFLIMAEIRSGQAMGFLQTLQNQGTAQRIGDSVWLLRAVSTADQLRALLSQNLSKQDRLFILDSFKNETAWFNIGADMDLRIRELWDVSA